MEKILLSLLIVISFTILTNFIRAQNPPDTIWTKQITFLNDGLPKDILPTVDGGYLIVINFSHPTTGNYQICIIKLNNLGIIENTQYIGDNGSKNVMAEHISPTHYGGAIIAGTDFDNQRTLLIRIDLEGDTLWTKNYSDWPDNNFGLRAIQTQTGFVILSLVINNIYGIYNALLIETDESGNYLSARPIYDEGSLRPIDMLKTAENLFVVVSYLQTPSNNLITLFKANITGFRYWTSYISIPEYQYYDLPLGFKQCIDNGFLIGGTIITPSSFHLGFLVKTYPNGELKQYKIYGDTTNVFGQQCFNSIVEMQDQGIFIAGGESWFDPPNLNKAIFRTNNLMGEVYEIYFRYIGESSGEWTTIQKCFDGDFVTCGYFMFNGIQKVVVAKIESDLPSIFINHTNLGLAITDNNVTTDIINFVGLNKSQTSALLSVDVMIDTVLHTSTGDLEFTLSHNGIIDTLIYHAGESGDNFIQTILSDVAQSPVDLASAPFTGFYRPTSSLSKFSGVDPTGDWTLSILDNVAGNTGMLNSWGLRFYFEGPVGVDDETPDVISNYKLYQNYPNPFNPSTTISWQLPENGLVTLKIFDVLGKEVATLVDEDKPAGEYKVDFSVGQDSNPDIASGIYFYQLRAGDFIQTKKMLLLK